MDNNILSILEAREETRVIEIVDSLFQAPLMKPVFKAISMEHNLSKINLSNNVLHDEGIMVSQCNNCGAIYNTII